MFEEVPEKTLKERLTADPELRQLYERHLELDRAVNRAAAGAPAVSDERLREMKVERLHLKEQLSARWASEADAS